MQKPTEQQSEVVESIDQQTALRAVPMTLFPTMDSLQAVLDLAMSQLPVITPNSMNNLLMVYHNTLLNQINKQR